ncbi:MAG TPA: OmpA family protein [Terriglobia bacterium]|nr:OmpA family protein [Terriglobia bacterium]
MKYLRNQPVPQGGRKNDRGSAKSGFIWFAGVVLVALGVVFYILLVRLGRVDREVRQLNSQADQASMKAQAAAANAAAALDRASNAEQSAHQAANQRDEAEKQKSEAQQQAQQAEQQVQVAQQQAAQAEAKADEYRKQREAELDNLQQTLGQIASTRRTAMGVVMTLGSKSIRFAFDKSTLRPEDREVLSRIAGILSTLKGYQISVYGYTDDVGTKDYNLKLSERRAQSVYDYLSHNGLDPTIMTTKGFGEADPLVAGDSEEARSTNRRVEIGIVDSTIKPLSSLNQ